MAQKPIVVGLMLCEQVIVEEMTRNITPVNCFTQKLVRQLPSELFPFVAFAILTDGAGEISFEVVIQRLDNLDEIYRRSVAFRFANPLQEARCLFRIRDCSFPIEGSYELSLFADGEPLAQRRFRITQKEKTK